MSLTTLNQKHWLFVEAYDGDEVTALRTAGYEGTDTYLKGKAAEFMKDPLIQEAIKNRSKLRAKQLNIIADREERQALWSSVMRNQDPHYREEKDANGIPIPQGNIPLATRLKSAELLGKSEGDFIEKIELTAKLSLSDTILQSYRKPLPDEMDDDAIEAEYWRLREEDDKARGKLLEQKEKPVEEPKLQETVSPLARFI